MSEAAIGMWKDWCYFFAKENLWYTGTPSESLMLRGIELV